MPGVAERLIWKNNKLQIIYKKWEDVEEMFFSPSLGSHTLWAPGLSSAFAPVLCRALPDPKTRQIQVAADTGPADKKRWEASKWSPEAAFQMESSSQARELSVRPLQAPLSTTSSFRPFTQTLELSLTSKTCSAPSPGHCRHGFPGIAHNTAVFGMQFHCSQVQRTRRSSKEFPSCHTKRELLPNQ